MIMQILFILLDISLSSVCVCVTWRFQASTHVCKMHSGPWLASKLCDVIIACRYIKVLNWVFRWETSPLNVETNCTSIVLQSEAQTSWWRKKKTLFRVEKCRNNYRRGPLIFFSTGSWVARPQPSDWVWYLWLKEGRAVYSCSTVIP